MDIQRPASVAQAKKRKQIILGAVAVIVIAAVSVVLAQLKPAAPSVSQACGSCGDVRVSVSSWPVASAKRCAASKERT